MIKESLSTTVLCVLLLLFSCLSVVFRHTCSWQYSLGWAEMERINRRFVATGEDFGITKNGGEQRVMCTKDCGWKRFFNFSSITDYVPTFAPFFFSFISQYSFLDYKAPADLLGTFRLDYKYEIEYEYDFSVLVFKLHIITTHTNFIP